MEKDKVIVFAGIGRLGIPIVKKLVKKGQKISISYRQGRSSERTVKNLIDILGEDKVLGVNADISYKKESDKLIQKTLEKYGRIDGLIGIASYYPNEKNDFQRWEKGGRVTEEDWKFYNSNFIPIRNSCLSFLESMNQNPIDDMFLILFADSNTQKYVENIIDPYFNSYLNKSIIDVNSNDLKEIGIKQLHNLNASPRDTNPYVLSKRDISYLTRKLALDYSGGKVRVNSIAPGAMLPPPDKTLEETKLIVEKNLLKRWGHEKPIVQAVEYLIDAKFITGAEIYRMSQEK